jgi:hypothetical protein
VDSEIAFSELTKIPLTFGVIATSAGAKIRQASRSLLRRIVVKRKQWNIALERLAQVLRTEEPLWRVRSKRLFGALVSYGFVFCSDALTHCQLSPLLIHTVRHKNLPSIGRPSFFNLKEFKLVTSATLP